MFEDLLFITVTGLNYYYGMKPFSIGDALILIKEPDNIHDAEAIRVELPMLGKVGYVANSPHTIAKGCVSAGRLQKTLPDECVAVVRFQTQTKVIAQVFPDKRLRVNVEVIIEDQQEIPSRSKCDRPSAK